MTHEQTHLDVELAASAVPEQAPGAGSDLGVIWAAARRRWRTLLMALLFVLLPSFAWVLFSPPLFESHLQLVVKPTRLESLRQRDSASESMLQAELGTEVEVLRSRGVLERVVTESDLVKRERDESSDQRLARAVRRLQRDLDIEAVPRTNLISVRYVDREPLIAAKVLNLLATSYLEKHTTLHRHPKAVGFFDAQIEELSQTLGSALNRLREFKSRHGISVLELQKELNLRRIDELQTEVHRLEADLQGREQVVAFLERRQSNRPFEAIGKESLHEKAELIGVRARRDELRTMLTQLQSDHQALEAATSEYQSLTTDVDIAEKTLVVYRSRMEEERIESLLDRERILEVAVVDPASPSPLPVDRHPAITVALGFCLAVLTGIGAALLADRSARRSVEGKARDPEIPQINFQPPQPVPSSD